MNIIINNIQKAECFAAIFQHIKLMTDNINMMFEKDRLYVQSMDSARVSIFEIIIPSTWFDVYTVETQVNLGLNSAILYKILNARDKQQSMQIEYDPDNDDKLSIHYTSPDTSELNKDNCFDKHFELPLVDIETELLAIVELDYQAEISFPSTYFASIINQLKMFGDTMEIECSEEKIVLYATSVESGKMCVEIKIDDLTAFSILEGEEMKLSFSLMYLHNICMYNKLAKDIELKISTNYPMRIDYDLGEGAKIVYFLAPKMSDNDD
jgi:proliferating cell nuclear antigen